jgi:beta-lactamase superfamily II metal-dependent hydrolase
MEFYEIDFIEAGEHKSGDAIALRYGNQIGAQITQLVHVVDGGYATSNDGQKLIDHINTHYEGVSSIDHVVLTHPDTDHASGLKIVVETCKIGILWMNRPWLHVDTLLPQFAHEYTREGLIARLKKDFPHTAELEEIAIRKGITINDAFQGDVIGKFTVMAPTKSRYIELVVASEKTPKTEQQPSISQGLLEGLRTTARYLKALWGEEGGLKGHTDGTTCENEMSIIQYAQIAGHKILLTGDAGIEGLEEAHQYATLLSIPLPGLHRFQVPHHGARRNLSSDILDKWLGTKLSSNTNQGLFESIVSANRNDDDHPKKAVVRALRHRGANVATTKKEFVLGWSMNKPIRTGWRPVVYEPYPEDTEND